MEAGVRPPTDERPGDRQICREPQVPMGGQLGAYEGPAKDEKGRTQAECEGLNRREQHEKRHLRSRRRETWRRSPETAKRGVGTRDEGSDAKNNCYRKPFARVQTHGRALCRHVYFSFLDTCRQISAASGSGVDPGGA